MICYLASACPPGQYIAQNGSGKGHNSGLSVQNRQVGVKSLKEISGVKLWELTISVLSVMKFFISSSDLTLLTYRRIKRHVPLWNAFKVAWPGITPLNMSARLKRVECPPVTSVYVSSTCLSRMRRPAWHVCNVTKTICTNQSARLKTHANILNNNFELCKFSEYINKGKNHPTKSLPGINNKGNSKGWYICQLSLFWNMLDGKNI